ncbi:MAG TPA: ribbon-helix-helix protein, CopG family [Thermoanaerobaculia bacterium]|nr:ribbon-helix-helix protein, CopG family [Thermoanaerobaculia bacterium]
MPTSIRLDTATDRALEELAKRRGKTKSQLVRGAIEELLARDQLTPYELVEDLIGSVSGGPADLSERSGEKLRALLSERRK